MAATVCKRQKVDLPVTIVGTNPVIAAQFNGQDVRLMLDSGAFWSMISAASAEQFKLRLSPAPFGLVIKGIGGSITAQVATVKTFTIADVPIANVDFLVGGSEVGRGSVGFLGQNFLQKWDVEYDLENGMVRLFKDVDCSKFFRAYWLTAGQSFSVVDISRITPTDAHTVGDAYVNGVKIRVIFDTGAATSVLSIKAAARAGVKSDSAGVVPAGRNGGIGRHTIDSYIATFASFKIGDGEEIQHAKLRIADIDFEEGDMLLGADFFLSHHIFVANSQRKLYITYNGGPVFNLSTASAATTPTDAANPALSTKAINSPDAAEFARRGSAFAGRRDFDAALGELNRAIELAPADPEYSFLRGTVYRQKGERQPALADFNHVLELQPEHVPALMARAEIRIASRDLSGAGADLAIVDRVAAKPADVRFEMAQDFVRADMMPPAIAQLDLWIAAHGEDSRLPQALGTRCLARAMANQDLPGALKDCNAAIRRGDAVGYSALANRGLVRLRLGDYGKSVEDYDAALKLDPKNAWAFYGRGIANLRQHKTADGNADLTKASGLRPKVSDAFERIGIVP